MSFKLSNYTLWTRFVCIALGAGVGIGFIYFIKESIQRVSKSLKPDSVDTEKEVVGAHIGDKECKEHVGSDEHRDSTRNKGIIDLLSKIGEEEVRRATVTHRYVTCNICNESPIKGIRYKCAYCTNFDMCEACELDNPHPKTHLLLKIRIPTPPLLSTTAYLTEFLYPGSEAGAPLDPEKTLEYSRSSHCKLYHSIGGVYYQFPSTLIISTLHNLKVSDMEIQNLHAQFKCLSDVNVENGAISFSCFRRLFPGMRTDHIDPARVFFKIIDHGKDGLITFDEFLSCLSVAYRGNLEERIEYAFRAYDSDEDGLITRGELEDVIKAYHIISMALIKDFMRSLEKSMLEVFDDRSGNTVSSIFGGPIRSHTEVDTGQHVHINQDNAGKSSSDSYSGYEDSSPISLSPHSGDRAFMENETHLFDLLETENKENCRKKHKLSEIRANDEVPRKMRSIPRRTSILTSQLEDICDVVQENAKDGDKIHRRKDSLLVNNFAENAIKLEVEQIFLKAVSVSGGNPDEYSEGFDIKSFSSLSIQEPNIINAVFDSITCIF